MLAGASGGALKQAAGGSPARVVAGLQESDLIRLKREAKMSKGFYVDDEPKLAFVVRIRGLNKIHPKVSAPSCAAICMLPTHGRRPRAAAATSHMLAHHPFVSQSRRPRRSCSCSACARSTWACLSRCAAVRGLGARAAWCRSEAAELVVRGAVAGERGELQRQRADCRDAAWRGWTHPHAVCACSCSGDGRAVCQQRLS